LRDATLSMSLSIIRACRSLVHSVSRARALFVAVCIFYVSTLLSQSADKTLLYPPLSLCFFFTKNSESGDCGGYQGEIYQRLPVPFTVDLGDSFTRTTGRDAFHGDELEISTRRDAKFRIRLGV